MFRLQTIWIGYLATSWPFEDVIIIDVQRKQAEEDSCPHINVYKIRLNVKNRITMLVGK